MSYAWKFSPTSDFTPHSEKGGKRSLVALNGGWVCQRKKLRVSWQLHYDLCQYTPFPKPGNIWLIQLLGFVHRVFILQCSLVCWENSCKISQVMAVPGQFPTLCDSGVQLQLVYLVYWPNVKSKTSTRQKWFFRFPIISRYPNPDFYSTFSISFSNTSGHDYKFTNYISIL